MHTFKRNLYLSYGLSLLLLLLTAVASYTSIRNLLTSAELVNHTNEVKQEIDGVLSALVDAETGQRGFLLTGIDSFLDPYNSAFQTTVKRIERVKQMTLDNPAQQASCDVLKARSLQRLAYMADVVTRKRVGETIPDSLLVSGRVLMDEVRNLIGAIKQREENLLIERTAAMNRFAAQTPVLILVAALLSIVITLVSLFRVISDFDRRYELQNQLQQKDREITARLNAIEGVAGEISSGNYKITVSDEGEDALGSIAGSLNAMAASLDRSFTDLSEREWLQSGIAGLNNVVLSDHDMASLTHAALNFIVEYSGSQAGAFYLQNGEGLLALKAAYALPQRHRREYLAPGEGLAGQAARELQVLEVKGLSENDYTLSYVAGEIKPRNLIAIPVLFNRELKGVMELAAMTDFIDNKKAFLTAAAFNVGIVIHTVQNRQRVQELLEETQSQAEELQTQQSELENINAELEAQAEKLQASEEELKVQQEELQQANQELEERSRLLEEKNEMILERNLEIQQKAEELAVSTRYKSEFLANMSHELRTPLNSILLLSRLLSENHEQNLSSDQIDYANVIQSSGKGLLSLIDEILDLSKIEAGKMELEYSQVDLAALSDELRGMFAPLAKHKGIAFGISLAGNLPAAIETDRMRLEQILRNLLSNALKFTKTGSVDLAITSNQGWITFAVTDTGIGIPKEKHRTIFEAFQQADGSTRRQYGGTGLGLSISRELAKLLGGEIRLQSEEGKGSEFSLLLPENKAIPATQAEQPVSGEDLRTNLPAPPGDDPKKYINPVIPPAPADDRENIVPGHDKVILIVEDDTAFALSLLEYTRQKGYKGIIAVRGDEAADLARHFKPIGILLDIQLPVKSGWEVMDELKADPLTRPIPVHMMSSFQSRMKSLSKGAVDFISKPVAFEKLGEMFARIEEALSRHPKKVMIVEENARHAQALAYFLKQYDINSEIRNSVGAGIDSLREREVNCVILDMDMPEQRSYDTLEAVKKTPGLENIPIIIFTGKSLSHIEEMRIRQYADSIVIKTAHSYQRILDEVSLFLHLVEENKKDAKPARYQRMGELEEVLRDKTILVADDDVRNIFSLTKSLENYGVNVISAVDGQDALQQLEAHRKVDLVLMDMMMPEMDGYESTRRIRAIPKYRNLPIIAVTAKAMAGDRSKCIAAGASDYITKPVDVDQLISLLRVWLYQ